MPSTRSRTRAGTSGTSRNTEDTGTLQSTIPSTHQSTPVSTQGIESLAGPIENEASAASGTIRPETDSEHHGAVDGEVNGATVNNGCFNNSNTPDAGADVDNGQSSPQVRTPADADVASPRSGFREPLTGGAPSAQAEPGHDRAPMRALADAELRLEQRVMRRVDAALDDVTARIGRAIQMAVSAAVAEQRLPQALPQPWGEKCRNCCTQMAPA